MQLKFKETAVYAEPKPLCVHGLSSLTEIEEWEKELNTYHNI
jgi:hypothetical protein